MGTLFDEIDETYSNRSSTDIESFDPAFDDPNDDFGKACQDLYGCPFDGEFSYSTDFSKIIEKKFGQEEAENYREACKQRGQEILASFKKT